MVTIGDVEETLEFSLMCETLRCSAAELNSKISKTLEQYPYVASKSKAIFLVAKQQHLKYEYNTNHPTRLVKVDETDEFSLDDLDL